MQFKDNDRNVGTPEIISTSSINGTSYAVQFGDVPSNYHLANPYTADLSNNDYDHVYDVNVVGNPMTDYFNFNGNSLANGKTTKHGDYSNSDSVSAPIHYHFINGNNGKFNYNGSTHTFDVAPNQIILHFSNGDYKVVNTTDAGNTFTVPSEDAPDHYSLVGSPTITFGDNAYNHVYNVDVTSGSSADTIYFTGDSADQDHPSGAYNSTGSVAAPSDYHFIKGSTGKFTYDGGSHTFNVAPNQIILHFSNGAEKTIDTSNIDSTSYTVRPSDVPDHYSLSSNPTITFGDNANNHVYNLNVTSESGTDTIDFNGNSLANTSSSGTYNSNGNVNAPNHYHFIDGSNGSSRIMMVRIRSTLHRTRSSYISATVIIRWLILPAPVTIPTRSSPVMCRIITA